MLPQKIKLAMKNDSTLDWNEKQDLIEFGNNPFDEQNQYDWWKMNVKIRRAFNKVEKEIREKIKKEEKINKRIITWSRIANLVECDRNTLRHHKRNWWTEERFNSIIEMKSKSVVNNVINDKRKIPRDQVLEEKVVKARNETVKWMNEYHKAKYELNIMQKTLKFKDQKIFELEQKLTAYIVETNKNSGEIE